MNINTLIADGVTLVASSPAYDGTKKQKGWTYAVPAGADPADLFVYKYPVNDTNSKSPAIKWLTGAVSYAEAAVANLPPLNYQGAEAVGIVPVPMDPAKVPAGYTLQATPFGPSLVADAAPVVTAPNSEEDRILAGVEEILQHDGLPPV